MSTENIDIRVREDGSRVVKRNISDIGDTAEKAASGVDLLKRALGAIAAYLAIDQIKQYADAWSSAAGQIRIVTRNTEEAAAVTGELFKVAQTTRQGFSEIVDLYGRTARSAKELGVSQAQLIKFTENVGKTLAASSTSSQQASGALLQMGQALGSGVIRAEEFNSILEGAPAILQVVANNIKGAEGSIGKLRKMMLDGKLTSKEFFDAMLKGTGEIDEKFGKSSYTIAQALTIVRNAFMKWVGEMDQSLGISQKIGEMAKWVAENMKTVSAVLLAVGAAALVAFTPTMIVAFASAVRGLWVLVATNPFTALAVAIAAAAGYLSVFKDEISAGIDETTTLGDVFRALGEKAVEGFAAVQEVASEVFSGLADFATEAYAVITGATEEAAQGWAKQYFDFYADVGDGFAGVAKGIARTIDAIAGLLTGMGIAVVKTLGGIPKAIMEMFNRTYNTVVTVVENMINTVINGVNRMRKAVGMDLLETVKFDRKAVDEKFFQTYGEDISKSIQEGFQQQGGFMEKWVDGVFTRAQEIGKDRASKLGGQTGVDLTQALGKFKPPGPDEKELEKQRKELEKLKNELRSLLNTIAPVEGAKLEMAKAEEILTNAVKKGLITTEQQARYLELLKLHYRDIVDPIGKVNRELDEQVRLLGLSSRARQVETQMLAIEKDLRSQGILLNQEETAALRAKLEALQKLNEKVAAQDQLLANSVEQRRAFTTQIEAITALLNDPNSGFTSADATNALMSGFGQEMFAGTQEAIDAQLARFQTMYQQIEQMRQADLISDQTAQQMKGKVDAEMAQTRLSNTQSFFGSLAVLSKSGNSKIAAIGKAAAATQATIDGVLAVQKALASAPPPVNYALAAAVGAAAAANVAQILGTNLGFMTGGSFTVGGSGGADSQMVAFRATPGEQVAVSTPTQVRKGDPNKQSGGDGSGSGQTNNGIRILNVIDPNLMQDYLTSSQGEKTLVNVIQRNSSAIRASLEG